MPFFRWSLTASVNASADPTINYSEGQAPSSLNDSARAMMAALKGWGVDTAGSLITGGTATAYTLATNQVFTSKALMDGAEISFTVNATNGASPTLNVDGLGGDPITLDGVNAVPTGTLIAGSVYTAVYYFSGTAWRLKNFYQLPFTVPIGGTIDFFGTASPNSNFVFPYGQAISRATYSALFTMMSTTFGPGDGSTTFNIPDLRGRVVAGKDDMGGSAASRIGSVVTDSATIVGATLGSVGGSSTHVTTLAELPTGITSAGNISVNVPSAQNVAVANAIADGSYGSATSGGTHLPIASGSFWSGIGTLGPTGNTMTSNNTSGSAHAMLQPTIIANKLLRII
ncbi:phage tail protein [Bradyrhizobium sp. CSS354]|uniref:phage tail protein n=1 Tax=Bradyrhizobium sp. CSS354 TaxID=2699172 RepID=UPI0023AEBEE0|nr:phage tail protein [Bradyrhizobium sp. CSS354]MDE5460198.1 phage tail protein [Bradyrhizobium sp. CSS354]